jgi:hypothetical protein
MVKAHPEWEVVGTEWVDRARSLVPHHTSLGKPLASPAAQRQITRQGINVIFPQAEFITVYGKINANLHE